MARGIIYVMSTVVPGLVKIGKTGIDKFESRMYSLERNGYYNVVGLQRRFAIIVEDYDEKEILLDDIFSKSRVEGSELFALDIDLVIQLLSSFDGEQIYPKTMTKDETFGEASKERQIKANWELIPDGEYYLSENVKKFGKVTAKMRVEDGMFIVLAGSGFAPHRQDWEPISRRNAPVKDNILLVDIPCNSPSTAAWIPLGHAGSGWNVWKTADGKPIDIFRKNKD